MRAMLFVGKIPLKVCHDAQSRERWYNDNEKVLAYDVLFTDFKFF